MGGLCSPNTRTAMSCWVELPPRWMVRRTGFRHRGAMMDGWISCLGCGEPTPTGATEDYAGSPICTDCATGLWEHDHDHFDNQDPEAEALRNAVMRWRDEQRKAKVN